MDGKVASPDRRIAWTAKRQYGVISLVQMRGFGVSDDAVRARVLSGRLHRVHRGVYAVGHAALSLEGRCMAAVLAVGGGPTIREAILEHWGAAVSHHSAASLWGLLPAKPGPCDVIVRGNGGKARRADLRLHRPRSLAAADVTLCRGIPVTTPTRTFTDLRRAISLGRSDAIRSHELRKAIRQANVIGLPVNDEDAADRTRSDLEADFLSICKRYRLPRPEVNVLIGPCLVDFLWREEQLVVETDSYRYHRGQVTFQDDRKRELDLMRLGYGVLRLSEAQIDDAPKDVAAVLSAELRKRRGSQPPRADRPALRGTDQPGTVR
jgi:very-short-patch-repair endonuclease